MNNDDIQRCKTYITRPDLVTTNGCIDWIQELISEIEKRHTEETMALEELLGGLRVAEVEFDTKTQVFKVDFLTLDLTIEQMTALLVFVGKNIAEYDQRSHD